ncbi:hypothetical protein P3T76_007467 [Phytophthora citrophthora]|uniref:Crinkler effector protein N-terminal domain-containing protein n=1 Tax=Phytophthora citrophthora TaxID=4793 RepID=A0AAD9LLR5_9STRA|nr:hypothetical protein P3T76_007467 [Phytophthora citrophthora]
MVKLFCAVVGVAGSAFEVDIAEDASVPALKKAIAVDQKYDFAASKLQLFLAKTADGGWLRSDDPDVTSTRSGDILEQVKKLLNEEIDPAEEIGDLFGGAPTKKTIHVLVVVPPVVGSKRSADGQVEEVLKRLKLIDKTLTEFTPLAVKEEEFQLDKLSLTQQSDDPIVMTPTLHEFWKMYGEFPPYYFVRMEEVMFWKVMKKLLFGEGRVVIIGSPGVGKSCFLMLIAFYLACIEKKEVLVIRRLKERKRLNAVVYFDGNGFYARLSGLRSRDIEAIRGQFQDSIVLVDGFTQAGVDNPDKSYLSFDLLATSCQFDAKHDDRSKVVVLPAWRDADLLQYAKSTKWVIETGLRTVLRKDTPIAKLVKEQHFYSGGSLREFCKERQELEERVEGDCCAVGK